MFVDASALVAILTDEPEAQRCSDAIRAAAAPITSPVAVLETVLALMRPDKLALPGDQAERLVLAFVEEGGIDIRDMPPAREATRMSVSALRQYRKGRHGLNLGDCLHYAWAKHFKVPILATADEFRKTDLEVVD